MDYASFLALVNGTFRIKLPSGEVPLVLVECTKLRQHGGQREEPFSLLFRGPAEPVLAQRIYTLEHEPAAALEIFLVPIGKDASGVRYEAVFN